MAASVLGALKGAASSALKGRGKPGDEEPAHRLRAVDPRVRVSGHAVAIKGAGAA